MKRTRLGWFYGISTTVGANTPGQSGAGSDGNEEVLCIPQSSSITEASPSDCLVSYTGHLFGESYPAGVGIFYGLSKEQLSLTMFVGWFNFKASDTIWPIA